MKKFSKVICLMLAFIMIIAVLGGCKSEPAIQEEAAATEEVQQDEEAATAEEDMELTIGYIMGGPDLWNQSQSDAIKYTCDKLGWSLVTLNSEYNSEKELSNAEDILSRNVDAVIMFTVNASTGQKVAQMCNEADVPLFLLDGDVGEGPGEAVTVSGYDFYECGKIVGEYLNENRPDSNLAVITGLPGAGIIEAYQEGLESILSDSIKMVDVQPGDWDRAKAMSAMENMLTSKKDIDVVYVHNEEMAMGAVKALKNAGKLGEIEIVSANGSPDGITMLENGEMLMTVTESPSYEGVAAVKAVRDYFNGMEVPERILVPLEAITIDNIEDILTWDVSDALLDLVGI